MGSGARASDGWSVEAVEADAGVKARWRELADEAQNLFATPEWVEAWWTHLGAGQTPRYLACRDAGGAIVAVAPMAVGRIGPVRVVRFAGHGPADAQGPACAPGLAARALASLADGLGDAGVLLAERVPAAHLPEGGFVELRREPSPAIDIDSGWDAYLQSRSSNMRSQIRRKERKLERENGLAFRLASAESLDADLDDLFRLHAARWGEEGSGAFEGGRAEFHRDFARRALGRGWLRLWVAEVEGGKTVAAWYGFRFAEQEWYYQSGRDPAWDRSSVGLVLLAHTIRSAAQDGIGRYRLLRGGEAYKDRFATSDEPVVTIGHARTASGRAQLRLARAAASSGVARKALQRLRG